MRYLCIFTNIFERPIFLNIDFFSLSIFKSNSDDDILDEIKETSKGFQIDS